MNITYLDKSQDDEYNPAFWNAADANSVKQAVNSKADKEDLLLKADITDLAAKANTSALALKADKVNGVVPLAQLPSIYISGGTGTGTQSDPYVFGSGGLSTNQLITFFQSLPNFAPDRILQGNLTWIDPPTATPMEQLATPSVTFVSTTGDATTINWSNVTFTQFYTLQRSTSNSFASTTTVYSGANRTFTDTGLSPSTTYYYRIRGTASGFTGSNYGLGNVTTDVAGNVTPNAPTAFIANDALDTFTFTNASGYATNLHEYRIKQSAWTSITNKPVTIGNIAVAIGELEVRVKAHTGVNAGAVLSNNVAYTVNAGIGNTVNLTIEDPNATLVNNANVWTKAGTGPNTPYDAGIKFPANVKARLAVRNLKSNTDTRIAIGIDETKADGFQGWSMCLFMSPFQGETYIEVKEGNIGIPNADKKATVNFMSIARTASGVWTQEESNDGVNWTVLQTFAMEDASEKFITISFEGGSKVYNPQLITY